MAVNNSLPNNLYQGLQKEKNLDKELVPKEPTQCPFFDIELDFKDEFEFKENKYQHEDNLDLTKLLEDDYEVDFEWLPEVIWMRILDYLSTTELCKMALVSKRISSIALTPKFWSTSLAKNWKNKIQEEGIVNFLCIGRFSKVKSLDFAYIFIDIEELSALLDHIVRSKFENLQSLNLRLLPLNLISIELLSAAFTSIHSVNISYSWASSDQCIALFKTISNSQQIALKVINLTGVILRDVPAYIIGPAVAKLEEVILTDCFLQTGHVESILHHCLHPSSNTKVLVLGRINKYVSSPLAGLPTIGSAALVELLLPKVEEKLEELSYYFPELPEQESQWDALTHHSEN